MRPVAVHRIPTVVAVPIDAPGRGRWPRVFHDEASA
jgi:hypothetical protein